MKKLPLWNFLLVGLALASASQAAQAGQITGRLLLNGLPIDSAQIFFRNSAEPALTYGSFSDETGTFRTRESGSGLPTGTYDAATLSSMMAQPSYLVPYRTGIQVTNGTDTDIGNVNVLEADRFISGNVGGGIPGFNSVVAKATIDNVDYVVWATTGDTSMLGAFRLPAVKGSWTITASYSDTVLGEVVVTVGDDDVNDVQIGQPVAQGTIIGRLVRDGQPVPSANISVRYLDEGELLFLTTSADESGTFSILLPAGNYELGTYISNSSEVTNLVENVPAFFLDADQTRNFGDLEISEDLFAVTGTVLDGSMPAIFADLTAEASLGGASFKVWSETFYDGSGVSASFCLTAHGRSQRRIFSVRPGKQVWPSTAPRWTLLRSCWETPRPTPRGPPFTDSPAKTQHSPLIRTAMVMTMPRSSLSGPFQTCLPPVSCRWRAPEVTSPSLGSSARKASSTTQCANPPTSTLGTLPTSLCKTERPSPRRRQAMYANNSRFNHRPEILSHPGHRRSGGRHYPVSTFPAQGPSQGLGLPSSEIRKTEILPSCLAQLPSRFRCRLALEAALCAYSCMRTTIELPTALFRDIKAFTAARGTTLKEFMTSAARRALQTPEKSPRMERPPVPRGTRRIRASSNRDIAALMEKEDVRKAR